MSKFTTFNANFCIESGRAVRVRPSLKATPLLLRQTASMRRSSNYSGQPSPPLSCGRLVGMSISRFNFLRMNVDKVSAETVSISISSPVSSSGTREGKSGRRLQMSVVAMFSTSSSRFERTLLLTLLREELILDQSLPLPTTTE